MGNARLALAHVVLQMADRICILIKAHLYYCIGASKVSFLLR